MAKRKIILIGGGGHCKVVISILKKLDNFEIIGIVDNYKSDSFISGIKIIGTDNDLKDIYKRGIHNALITVGSTKDNTKRYRLFNLVKKIGYKFPIIVSPDAIVDSNVSIDEGTVIMPGCIINISTSFGKNCIVNSGAIVEHDCKIGDYCHIAPGAHISGSVEIGELSFIGIGSTIIQGVKVGKNVTIGAGSVIIKDIPDNAVVVGNPGKVIKNKCSELNKQ
jgi:UDP-perosamine 4-acetyltransferase